MSEHDDLEQVVQQAHGKDHYLVNVTEEPCSRAFPPGTRSWLVEHESLTCTHSPRCCWFGRVYAYRGHYTLIKDTEMMLGISLRDVIDRVTGALQN